MAKKTFEIVRQTFGHTTESGFYAIDDVVHEEVADVVDIAGDSEYVPDGNSGINLLIMLRDLNKGIDPNKETYFAREKK